MFFKMMALEMVGELVASLGNFTQRYEKTDLKLEISNSTFHECKPVLKNIQGGMQHSILRLVHFSRPPFLGPGSKEILPTELCPLLLDLAINLVFT
jgi:hypothetical protein